MKSHEEACNKHPRVSTLGLSTDEECKARDKIHTLSELMIPPGEERNPQKTIKGPDTMEV